MECYPGSDDLGLALRNWTEEILASGAHGARYAVYCRGYYFRECRGNADAAGRAFKAGTVTWCASVSKLYLTALVLLLHDARVLSMDTAIGEILPEVHELNRGVRLRSLLTHTAGLPKDHDGCAHPLSPEWLSLSQADVIRDLLARPWTKPTEEINRGWRYSNAGFMLLGHVAESVLMRPLSRLLEEWVLGPLNLKHTVHLSALSDRDDVASVGESVSPQELIGGTQGHSSPQSGIFATADDLLLFVQAWRQEPLKRIALVNAAFRDHVGRSDFGQGLGWFLGRSGLAFHPGSSGAHVWLDPHGEYAGALLPNGSFSSEITAARNRLASRLRSMICPLSPKVCNCRSDQPNRPVAEA